MTRQSVRLRMAAAVGLLLAGCAAGAWFWQGGEISWRAEPMPAWEKAFQRADPRWRGADGAYSVPFSGSHTLWLFGDTWITEADATGREQGTVIRNSLALQEISEDGPGTIRFFWEEGPDGPKAPLSPPEGPGWLWPLSGERIGASLFLFLGQFVRNDSEIGFEASGSWLFRVDNPEAPFSAWELNRSRIPFFRHTENGDLFFGAGSMYHEGFLYVYGVREDWSRGVEGRVLLVARTPIQALYEADFSAWRFFSGDGWCADLEKATALFDGAATEMSVSFLPGPNRFLAVYSYCGLSEKILARLSRHPEGPWGRPMTLYRCPEASWDEEYFCYAGKAHPECAREKDELIVTYAVNSWDLEDLQRDLRIYWPRFVRVRRP